MPITLHLSYLSSLCMAEWLYVPGLQECLKLRCTLLWRNKPKQLCCVSCQLPGVCRKRDQFSLLAFLLPRLVCLLSSKLYESRTIEDAQQSPSSPLPQVSCFLFSSLSCIRLKSSVHRFRPLVDTRSKLHFTVGVIHIIVRVMFYHLAMCRQHDLASTSISLKNRTKRKEK